MSLADLVLARRVASRVASDTFWSGAADDLHKFNALYAQVEKKPQDPTTLKKCVAGANKLAPLFVWAKKALTPETYTRLMGAWRAIGQLAKSKEASVEELLAGVTQFKDEVQEALHLTAPEHFTYEGFAVLNAEHIADEASRKVLAGLDYLKALFKKRGVTHLLEGAISKVVLSLATDEGAANFNSANRVLTISVTELAKMGPGRFIESAAGETLLHEFGHYIHLNYIKGEAAAAWDDPWEGIADLADPKNRHLRNDPDRNKKVQDLDVVTEYGKTNPREDFAETFMVFMAAPERLTPTSKFRMQRALSLSGLYGKQVLRLAKDQPLALRIAARFRP